MQKEILDQLLDSEGNPTVCLTDKEGNKKIFKVCDLMAQTWIEGYDPELHSVEHIDGNKENNRADNLKLIYNIGQR